MNRWISGHFELLRRGQRRHYKKDQFGFRILFNDATEFEREKKIGLKGFARRAFKQFGGQKGARCFFTTPEGKHIGTVKLRGWYTDGGAQVTLERR